MTSFDDPEMQELLDLAADATSRPSIETTPHAVMPQKVVVHVHCVESPADEAQLLNRAAEKYRQSLDQGIP